MRIYGFLYLSCKMEKYLKKNFAKITAHISLAKNVLIKEQKNVMIAILLVR